MEYCCAVFKQAVEGENCIRLIDSYEDEEYQPNNPVFNKIKVNVKPGYYIINRYAEGEMCLHNCPEINTRLKFCPWCGTKLKV